ncbi:HEPN domain-containing protein [Paenibacillus sp. Aloe-11]|uniref:HEPN domain-containing protein n=1 Tax=Paenibacillus sp. Aloe-11 TaxID=1050222 RepID=UPI0002D2E567|nr:HEPN domain-containing protein [Paenibacillus sp. Aloe-11]
MKMKFISKLYHFNTTTKLNRGPIIKGNIRISNSNNIIDDHFSDTIFKDMVGLLEFDYLLNGHYLYAISDLKENLSESKRIETLNDYLKFTQFLCSAFWLIKDNSINCENGYLYISADSVEQNSVSSNMRTPFFSNALGEREDVLFTREEIEKTSELFGGFFINEGMQFTKDETHNYLYNRATRIERFFYFLQSARTQSYLPSRIALYCTMIETIFCSEDNMEITHKIAERVGKFLGKDFDERLTYFKTIKQAYTIRSSTVHGDKIKKSFRNDDILKQISVNLDSILRECINKILLDKELIELLEKGSNEDLNKWYLELILK